MSEIDEQAVLASRSTCFAGVRGITFVTPQRPDECCGFGGTFSVFEEPVSARMGYDKVTDHHTAGAEYIVSADMSCLMHQKGCAERLGPADQVHPHRADPERSPGMKRHRPRRGLVEVHQGEGPRRIPRQAAVGPAQEARPRERSRFPEWEELRSLASAIKEHTLSHLADYLEEFERNAVKNGAHVHWAKDAAEHNQVVFDIMQRARRRARSSRPSRC